jgi:hypothetical protein
MGAIVTQRVHRSIWPDRFAILSVNSRTLISIIRSPLPTAFAMFSALLVVGGRSTRV